MVRRGKTERGTDFDGDLDHKRFRKPRPRQFQARSERNRPLGHNLHAVKARFAASDLAGQPWGDERHRFDLVVACEVLYYIKDIPATIERMRHLGRACFVTFFAPALVRVGPHLEGIEDLHKDWMQHQGETWLVCWWRNPE